MEDSGFHLESLPGVLRLREFDVVDCYIPCQSVEREEVDYIVASGKEPIYNCPLFITPELNPHSPNIAIREKTFAAVVEHIDRAKKIAAHKIVVASGVDPGEGNRDAEKKWFIEYLTRICAYAGPKLCVMIEPFDRSIGKNLLIGPTEEAVKIVEAVQGSGHDNIGLLMDMGHIPLMGETFEHAVKAAGHHIRHVHLGSCVMKDRNDPLYGDMHPPWGYPGGENDVREATAFLKCLVESGYINGETKATLTLEMRPYPGRDELDSLQRMQEKLEQAWEGVFL